MHKKMFNCPNRTNKNILLIGRDGVRSTSKPVTQSKKLKVFTQHITSFNEKNIIFIKYFFLIIQDQNSSTQRKKYILSISSYTPILVFLLISLG